MNTPEQLLSVINGSGFPLQIAAQHIVEENHVGWTVVHKEHAWQDDHGRIGFIDLVLRNENDDCLVVECKRVQDTAWLFFSDTGQNTLRRHCKAWVTESNAQSTQYRIGWADISLPFETHEAQFCCLRGQSKNDRNTFLERIAGEMVSATRALALEEEGVRRNSESLRFYFNVLVTTAELYFVSFEKSRLNIDDGTLKDATFHKVPYLRVRKQFAMREFTLGPSDWHNEATVDYRSENTIFVVEAKQLLSFLSCFNTSDIDSRSIKF